MSQPHPFSRSRADAPEQMPRLRARFFYNSNLAIDDPLAPVPPPAVGTAASKQAPRPFSPEDNAALDQAWNALKAKLRKQLEERDAEVTAMRERHVQEWKQQQQQQANTRASRADSQSRDRLSRSIRGSLDVQQGRSRQSSINSLQQSSLGQGRELGSYAKKTTADWQGSRLRTDVSSDPHRGSQEASNESDGVQAEGDRTGLDGTEEGTTGTPFIRAPARSQVGYGTPSARPSPRIAAVRDADDVITPTEMSSSHVELTPAREEPQAKVPVGEARLHHVTMPALAMEPSYWRPVNDTAPVTRGTWFYKDSMLPVEVDVANMLEAGYSTLKPWTSTWQDELNSAVEVGAVGEEKISYKLWPEPAKTVPESRPGTSVGSVMLDREEDSKEQRRADQVAHSLAVIENASKTSDHDNRCAGVNDYGRDSQKRSYQTSQVIYADATTAYILRPNLQPSDYYGRRPYANYIRKQHRIGIAVVRGFDQFAWDILHPSKNAQFLKDAARGGGSAGQAHRPKLDQTQQSSTARLLDAVRPKTTDLVLVIHGIGQKLSERVESYHFTHAMNAFRREMNVELADRGIRRYLRDDGGGVMILPVNWRSTLSFEEGGYRDGVEDPTMNNFTLKDITPESLPSVRNIISDVMLDIPYYLSHHQPKMISAVLREANRIYRLWCSNNPGFEKYGRVHLLAHSLGSVMALDILSNQPSTVNPLSMVNPSSIGNSSSTARGVAEADLDHDNPKHFAFDTTNLFLCGSPAGFFLLLKRAGLTPRRDREKPCSDGDATMPGVAGEEGDYGCIAVDNIYNVINPYDPVAYRLNACVDAPYSALLKPTFIPSVRNSWYSFSASKSSYGSARMTGPASRPGLLNRLPTSVELATHNFSREEIAERRAYLLNDNGQIDFFLRYGGGPLEIQYLTMLGAHSSYWLSKDFIKFLVMEIGRKPGKDNALQALRAVKKQVYASGEK